MSVLNANGVCCSSLTVVEYAYLWTIESFSQLLPGVKITSSCFPPVGSKHYYWQLLVHLEKKDDDVSLIVTPALKNTETKWSAKCEISILDSENRICLTKERTENFKWEQNICHSMQFPQITCPNEENYFKNDKLHIFCKTTLSKRINIAGINVPACHLTDDLETLLENMTLSDAVLRCQKESFPVHKIILACRSPVFKAMFSNEMLENSTNSVTIEDISPRALKELLRYMYAGKCDMDYEIAKDLLAAAEKYDLPRLKLMAGKVLQDNLSTSNACDTLVFADMYKCSELSEKIVDYICIHRKEIVKTDGWNLILEKPTLVSCLFVGIRNFGTENTK